MLAKDVGGGKRLLYEGYHRVPCFNMKLSDKPVLMPLAFSVYKVSHKVYIEASRNIPANLLLSNPDIKVEKMTGL